MSNKEQLPTEEQICWQGLQVPIQKDWRPLRVEGSYEDGSVTIGDMMAPIFQLRWIRPATEQDGKKWIEGRCNSAAGGQTSRKAPHPESFEHVAWIKDLAIREESQKTVWWGTATNKEVFVELLLTNLCKPAFSRWVIKEALPLLRVMSKTEESLWQIYSARFTVPPGYVLNHSRLAAGDISLEFKREDRQKLTVRQVYPAALALDRRPMRAWLRNRVTTDRRRLCVDQEQKSDHKVKWTGWKRYPFPLGWIVPNRFESLILEDLHLDRLLIAESEWKDGSKTTRVDDIVSAMQWEEA